VKYIVFKVRLHYWFETYFKPRMGLPVCVLVPAKQWSGTFYFLYLLSRQRITNIFLWYRQHTRMFLSLYSNYCGIDYIHVLESNFQFWITLYYGEHNNKNSVTSDINHWIISLSQRRQRITWTLTTKEKLFVVSFTYIVVNNNLMNCCITCLADSLSVDHFWNCIRSTSIHF